MNCLPQYVSGAEEYVHVRVLAYAYARVLDMRALVYTCKMYKGVKAMCR